MNCTTALETMLDAEPVELSGLGTGALARHVATCARCHAVAQQLAADTRLLTASIPIRTSRTHRSIATWSRISLVPAGLIAALLLVIARGAPDDSVELPSVAVPSPVAATVPASAPSASTVITPVRSPAMRTRAYPTPTPVHPVRIVPATATAVRTAERATTVVVDPPAGTRVAVMRTSNPKFTVVWLY